VCVFVFVHPFKAIANLRYTAIQPLRVHHSHSHGARLKRALTCAPLTNPPRPSISTVYLLFEFGIWVFWTNDNPMGSGSCQRGDTNAAAIHRDDIVYVVSLYTSIVKPGRLGRPSESCMCTDDDAVRQTHGSTWSTTTRLDSFGSIRRFSNRCMMR